MIHYTDDWLTVLLGDCREQMAGMEPESVHCVVTSPPYWGLRDYGIGELGLGLEPTPEAYVEAMVGVFREVKRVLRSDGTLWLNIGDSYGTGSGPTSDKSTLRGNGHIGGGPKAKDRPTVAGSGLKPKDLVGIPWRLAFALQADGWYLRSDIIWAKPNPMPESVTDRPTKAHEYLFLLTKSPRYYYDADAVREAHSLGSRTHPVSQYAAAVEGPMHHAATPETDRGDARRFLDQTRQYNPAGRNLRTVWNIATQPYPGAHFATFPEALVEPCIKAGTSERGVCPECGAPWVRQVELTPEYRALLDSGKAMADERGQAGQCQGETWDGIVFDHPLEPVPATVLDPFAGSGTVGRVANRLSRRAILIDLSAEYLDQAMLRNKQSPLGLGA